MKIAVFSRRNAQEILRDPVNLFFWARIPVGSVIPVFNHQQRNPGGSEHYAEILPHLWIVFAYAIVFYVLAILVFKHKMSGDRI